MKQLKAMGIIDTDIEGYYVYFPLVEQITTLAHYHDFYEIFLIEEGEIYHHVNDEKILLSSGDLVCVRPSDVHYYSKSSSHNCVLINLAVLPDTMHSLLRFLDIEASTVDLPGVPIPLTTSLSPLQRGLLTVQLKNWGLSMHRDKGIARLSLRALLAQLLTQFFIISSSPFDRETDSPPLWFTELYQEMQKREYIVEGRTALMRLANRSPEHVGRSFKTYLGITPSQFINELRLDYACDLLHHTDRSVADICYDVGFGNLSHFHHLFRERWDCSPLQYRNSNRQKLIPQ